MNAPGESPSICVASVSKYCWYALSSSAMMNSVEAAVNALPMLAALSLKFKLDGSLDGNATFNQGTIGDAREL